MEAAVQFDQVSKYYALGSKRAYLRYLLPGFRQQRYPSPMAPKGQLADRNELWALRNVSFESRPGEVLGIIGPNGAGKTTALSLLAGIMSPTSGVIRVRGRVGALIKLGAGFHPDLTGRENVYLNGSILGLRRVEIDRLYDEIVAFAEMEPFMDTPVKRYSSGMYVRLGFAVAVHIDPDILLVDEILSVGDVSFQARCLNRIGEICEAGTTVVFVSHNMHHIAGFCDRVVYLNQGHVKAIGTPGEAIGVYTHDLMNRELEKPVEDGSDMTQVNGSGRLVITDVVFLNEDGHRVEQIQSGEPVTVRVSYQAHDEVTDPILDVVIRDATRGNMFQATNRDYGVELGPVGSSGYFDVHFHSIPSNNQLLDFFISLWSSSHTERYDLKRFIKLPVMGNPNTSGRFLFDCEWRTVAAAENGNLGNLYEVA